MAAPGNHRGAFKRPGVRPLADLVARLVDPILARKAGISSGLISAWPEIAGERLAAGTRPEKVIWAARRSDLDPFEPATLLVACDGASAMRLQHETSELLQRIEAFFGYRAVGRIKIVQKAPPLPAPSRKPAMAALDQDGRDQIVEATARIDDPRLKRALERYGETVLSRNRARSQ